MDVTTIITDKMIFGGDCIGKIDGKTVLVPFSVPGEKVSVTITASHRDYDTARIIDVIEPSEHRVSPVCPLYGICGGCNTMHIDTDFQKELRLSVLRDCFERCGITPPALTAISGPDFNYRSRFQLTDGGLSKRASNTIIPITSCPVAEDTVNAWFAAVPPESRLKGRSHLFGSSFSGEKVSTACEPEPAAAVRTPAHRKIRDTVKKRYAGTVLSPETTATVNLLGKTISFDVRGFFQSNLFALESAIPRICGDMSGSRVLDMYSGCGTFSVFLADRFSEVTLVEHNRDALVFAEQNLHGAPHISYGMSGERWVQQCGMTLPPFDAAVVDPPRSGMEPAVTDYFCRRPVSVIHSLSCDPATHARDCARLMHAGYMLESLTLLDFYPHTSHIESLAVLRYHEKV